jgi:hypothetical protein
MEPNRVASRGADFPLSQALFPRRENDRLATFYAGKTAELDRANLALARPTVVR